MCASDFIKWSFFHFLMHCNKVIHEYLTAFDDRNWNWCCQYTHCHSQQLHPIRLWRRENGTFHTICNGAFAIPTTKFIGKKNRNAQRKKKLCCLGWKSQTNTMHMHTNKEKSSWKPKPDHFYKKKKHYILYGWWWWMQATIAWMHFA